VISQENKVEGDEMQDQEDFEDDKTVFYDVDSCFGSEGKEPYMQKYEETFAVKQEAAEVKEEYVS